MLLVAGIAVAAIVHVVRTGGGEVARPETTAAETSEAPAPTTEEPEALPAIVPLPGELREEGGLLWWSDERCQATALDLASGALVSLPGEHCRIWPSPRGDRVVATAASRSDALEGRGLVRFEYPPPEGMRVLVRGRVLRHSPGVIATELAWSPDGATVGACLGTREGLVVDSGSPDAAAISHAPGTLADACFPAWLADGRFAAVFGRLGLWLEGTQPPFLEPARPKELLPSVDEGSRRAITAVAGGEGELVLGLAAISDTRLLPASAALAVVTDAGRLRFSAFLPEGVLPAAVGLAPRGDALWYLDAGDGSAHVIEVPGGRELPPYGSRWVAWSPGGDYLALARGGSIVVLRWPDGIEVASLPVAATVLAWTLAPKGG